MNARGKVRALGATVVLSALNACGGGGAPAPGPTPSTVASPAATPNVQEAERILEQGAQRDRAKAARLKFEEFKASVYREPFEGGKFIVNGDTPISNEKQLREFFETRIQMPQQPHMDRELTLAQVMGLDLLWSQQLKRTLTYCVATDFGARHDAVVQAMAAATGAWEAVAQVDFTHQPAEDGNCNPGNGAVLFDVRPVSGQRYLARAFFPNEPRADRNVLINDSSFELPADDKLQLVGILRHELGHSLGFRHEHVRPQAGACFEDNDWRPLTNYDAFSVMHYPQCNGRGDWSLILTPSDKSGAACVYGAAGGFTIDTNICQPTQPGGGTGGGTAQTQTFAGQSVALNAEKAYPPFPVTPGTPFVAAIGGAGASGDPDLYVRFGARPMRFLGGFHCRPFTATANETCTLDVPAGTTQAFVMVHGYAAGSYTLTVTHTPPAP
jgi:hypothetical protein